MPHLNTRDVDLAKLAAWICQELAVTLAYLSHPDCLRHEMGPHHPECPSRLRAIEDRLTAAGVMDWMRHIEAPLVDPARLRPAHDARYLAEIEAADPSEGYAHVDPDTYMNAYTLRAARRAAEVWERLGRTGVPAQARVQEILQRRAGLSGPTSRG